MISKKLLSIILCGFLVFALFVVSCSEDQTSTSYETHPDGWMNPASEEFHGQAAIPGQSESCLHCHDAQSGETQEDAASNATTGVACYTCHALYPHLWESRVPGHKSLILSIDWDLNACGACHGVEFTGGNTGTSCLQCHTQPGGLSNCNLCHAQPPANDDGLPAGFTSGAYGAHARHVIDKGYACTECHATVTDYQHADGGSAEVSFDEALIANANGFSPAYAPPLEPKSGNGGCGSIYCHGGNPVSWRGDALACGSCHDVLPPPAGPFHNESTSNCHTCHPHVSPNSDYSTPDGIYFLPELEHLHVNGVANATFE